MFSLKGEIDVDRVGIVVQADNIVHVCRVSGHHAEKGVFIEGSIRRQAPKYMAQTATIFIRNMRQNKTVIP